VHQYRLSESMISIRRATHFYLHRIASMLLRPQLKCNNQQRNLHILNCLRYLGIALSDTAYTIHCHPQCNARCRNRRMLFPLNYQSLQHTCLLHSLCSYRALCPAGTFPAHMTCITFGRNCKGIKLKNSTRKMMFQMS
jgi:hypothetical protein